MTNKNRGRVSCELVLMVGGLLSVHKQNDFYLSLLSRSYQPWNELLKYIVILER